MTHLRQQHLIVACSSDSDCTIHHLPPPWWFAGVYEEVVAVVVLHSQAVHRRIVGDNHVVVVAGIPKILTVVEGDSRDVLADYILGGDILADYILAVEMLAVVVQMESLLAVAVQIYRSSFLRVFSFSRNRSCQFPIGNWWMESPCQLFLANWHGTEMTIVWDLGLSARY